MNKKAIKTKENVKIEGKKEHTILKEREVTKHMKVKANFDLSLLTFNVIHLLVLKSIISRHSRLQKSGQGYKITKRLYDSVRLNRCSVLPNNDVTLV